MAKKQLLFDQLRQAIRIKHYSIRTEQAYVDWARRFILFHHKCHPKDMGSDEVAAFLTDLAVKRHVAASTQNQALSALLFPYRHAPGQELEFPLQAVRSRRSHHLPTVLSREGVSQLLSCLSRIHQLTPALAAGATVVLTVIAHNLKRPVKIPEVPRMTQALA